MIGTGPAFGTGPAIRGPALFRRGAGVDPATQPIKPGTARRALRYITRHRGMLGLLILVTWLDAVLTIANPLILKLILDDGILHHRVAVVEGATATLVGVSLMDILANFAQTWLSAQIGQGTVYELRNQVFNNVQRQPMAFFARTQTGALVSRLNSDIVQAQQAMMTLLSQALSATMTITLVLAVMFYLSWQISLAALVLVPFFILPGRVVGKRLSKLTRQQMSQIAELSSMSTERFNVAGAMLAKLYGRPDRESGLFRRRSRRIRETGITIALYGQSFFMITSLLTVLALAVVFGLGGSLAIHGTFQVGTLLAMAVLLTRLYGPITQLSNAQTSVLTMMVCFDRVFEILDLKPLITERRSAYPMPARRTGRTGAPQVTFDRVWFRYPAASEITVASLESVTLPAPEHPDRTWVLRDISFTMLPGQLTALVGPSGAGKTTISQLVPRLYDPTSGTVWVDGHDLRDLTIQSLHDTVGVVTQDSHLFHDTIRANLLYACPAATEDRLVQACQAARIWDSICALPNGLDTVVGDRGYRMSGGEKQRLTLARLLLKAPPVIVLDEATAHLDSGSEAAIQQALRTVLAGRTSLVIAHRLSTIREADQILVIDAGEIRERGTHHELLRVGGLYAKLHNTQFAQQAPPGQTLASSEALTLVPATASAPSLRNGASTSTGLQAHAAAPPDGHLTQPMTGAITSARKTNGRVATREAALTRAAAPAALPPKPDDCDLGEPSHQARQRPAGRHAAPVRATRRERKAARQARWPASQPGQAQASASTPASTSRREPAKVKRLRQENEELRRMNETLKSASVLFAAELNRALTPQHPTASRPAGSEDH
ncbi:MAG TPA: ABC transporter transmembrane domain-containing protein [Streptosporangiaceae bacterium]|nr:ABC transporter transmembrane domain-containing protein [Streptosporangiaceae bacterium]